MEVASDQQKQKPQEAQIHDTGAREINNLMINASNAWPCNGGNAMSWHCMEFKMARILNVSKVKFVL